MIKRFIPNRPLRSIDSRRRWRMIGRPIIYGPMSRLRVSATAGLNNVLINTYGGCVEINDYVFFGHDVMLVTGTHDFRDTGGKRQLTRQTTNRNIVIEAGAWITSGVVIIGPCRVGANAVVGSGCVIDFDVPADTIVRLRQEFISTPIQYRDSPREEIARLP